MAKPFLKWAGGKGALLDWLTPRLPKTFGRYCEPFLGGGALFFALHRAGNLGEESAVLCDTCSPLIRTYREIREQVEDVIHQLAWLRDTYATQKAGGFYYDVRETVNLEGWTAARFIFLNRTCFNGLFRVNRSGRFNVPEGSYKKPEILNEWNLRAASEALQGVQLHEGDFEFAKKACVAGDLCYFDPPYVPVNATSFTDYSAKGFTMDDHVRLANTAREMVNNGVHVVLSNSDTQAVKDLYHDFDQHVILAPRRIGARVKDRADIQERIIVGVPK